jgi:hypothetical protein
MIGPEAAWPACAGVVADCSSQGTVRSQEVTVALMGGSANPLVPAQ